MSYKIYKSGYKNKKIDVVFPNGNGISIGADGYGDYIFYNFYYDEDVADKKKRNYIKRHIVREDWYDLSKRGTWARYLLWNKPTLEDSIKNMEEIFNIKIINYV